MLVFMAPNSWVIHEIINLYISGCDSIQGTDFLEFFEINVYSFMDQHGTYLMVYSGPMKSKLSFLTFHDP